MMQPIHPAMLAGALTRERQAAEDQPVIKGAQVATEAVDAAQEHTGFMAFCFGPTHRNQPKSIGAPSARGLAEAMDEAGWGRVGKRTLCAACLADHAEAHP